MKKKRNTGVDFIPEADRILTGIWNVLSDIFAKLLRYMLHVTILDVYFIPLLSLSPSNVFLNMFIISTILFFYTCPPLLSSPLLFSSQTFPLSSLFFSPRLSSPILYHPHFFSSPLLTSPLLLFSSHLSSHPLVFSFHSNL